MKVSHFGSFCLITTDYNQYIIKENDIEIATFSSYEKALTYIFNIRKTTEHPQTSLVLNRLVMIRDSFQGLVPLVSMIFLDELSGYFVLISTSSVVQFYRTLPEAKSAFAKII